MVDEVAVVVPQSDIATSSYPTRPLLVIDVMSDFVVQFTAHKLLTNSDEDGIQMWTREEIKRQFHLVTSP